MKRILCLLNLFMCVACSSEGLDGEYHRIEQTPFEQEKGMSSQLVISQQGQHLSLKNSWGDVQLQGIQQQDQWLIQHNNQDVFWLENHGEVVVLKDMNNTMQRYKFQKD